MMDELLRQELFKQTHWSPFNVILQKNNLRAPDDLDSELLEYYITLWKENPGQKFYNEQGIHEDPLPRKRE